MKLFKTSRLEDTKYEELRKQIEDLSYDVEALKESVEPTQLIEMAVGCSGTRTDTKKCVHVKLKNKFGCAKVKIYPLEKGLRLSLEDKETLLNFIKENPCALVDAEAVALLLKEEV